MGEQGLPQITKELIADLDRVRRYERGPPLLLVPAGMRRLPMPDTGAQFIHGRDPKSRAGLEAAASRRAAALHFGPPIELRPVGRFYGDERGVLYERLPGTIIGPGGELVSNPGLDGWLATDAGAVFVRRRTKPPLSVDELEREQAERRRRADEASRKRQALRPLDW